jgi:AcrR family transcriptional regulator
MPRIAAASVAEHREMRRDALVSVTADLMREQGSSAVTMSTIAQRAGLSRTAVYEYYSSAADLIADVIVDELATWADHLADCCVNITDPRERLETWIRSALAYVADGRHALVRAAGDATLPPVRRAQVATMHRDLARPLHQALSDLDVSAPERYTSYIWGIVESATRRIESGRAADDEVDAAVAFALSGIDLAR